MFAQASVGLLPALAGFPSACAQAPGAPGGAAAPGTAGSAAPSPSNSGASGSGAAGGVSSGLPNNAITGRTLTLADVVALAVGSNSGLDLARVRLQRAQELINQVNAQTRPQFRVGANDAYNSYPAFPSVIPLPTITNPILPDNGVIPTVVDQAAGIPTGFVGNSVSGGGISGTVSQGVGSGSGTGTTGTGSAGAAAGTPGAAAGTPGAAAGSAGASSTSAGTGSSGTAGGGGVGSSGAAGGGGTGAPSGTTNGGNGTSTPGTTGSGASSGAGSTSGAGTGTGQGTSGAGTTASPSTNGGNGNTGTGSGAGAGSTGTSNGAGTGGSTSGAGTGAAGGSPGTGAGTDNTGAGTGTSTNGNGSSTGTGTSGGTGTGLVFIPAIVTDYVADTRTLTQPPAGSAASALAPSRTDAAQAQPKTASKDASAEDASTPEDTRVTTPRADTPTASASPASRAVGKRNTYAAGASVSQYLDLFGVAGTTRGVEQDASRFYALDITRLQNETALVAKNLFFNALYAQALVTTQQEQVQLARENVRITQSRLRNGIVSRYDVLTAQATLANAQQQLLAAQDQQEQAQANLAYLLGTDPNQALSLQSPALPSLNQTVNLAQSTQIALRQRPELAQARSNISEARRLVRLANNGLLPTLGIVGTGEYTSNGSTVTPRSYATVSAQLAVPLDDGGFTRSRVRAARLDVQTQSILSGQLAQSVSLEVRQAAINIRNAQGQVLAAQTGLVQAVEARRLALERYTAGLGTFLDVLNAQATLAATRTNLANAQFFYQSSLAQLVRALGGR